MIGTARTATATGKGTETVEDPPYPYPYLYPYPDPGPLYPAVAGVEVKRQAPSSIRTLSAASVSVLVSVLVSVWDSKKYLQGLVVVDWEVRKEAPSMRKLFSVSVSVSVSMPVLDKDFDFGLGAVARWKYLESDCNYWIQEQLLGRCKKTKKKKAFPLRLWFRVRLRRLRRFWFWMWLSFGV